MAGTLPSVTRKSIFDLSKTRIGIVVSQWNEEITEALFQGAYDGLISLGLSKENIIRKDAPGSYELPLGALRLAEQADIDGVIAIGCVIQGETPHFDYICQAVSQGIMNVSLQTKKPVAFGVLTTLNKKQALDRAGGKYGNKGEEAAVTVVGMLEG